MSITSVEQIMDMNIINKGIGLIKEAGATFTECGNEVKDASDMCGVEVLSAEKKTMQDSMYNLADAIKEAKNSFDSLSDNISNAATSIQNAQYAEYNKYLAELKK